MLRAVHESELQDEALVEDFADEGELLGAGLDSSNTVHDRYQFESKFDFSVDTGRDPELRKSYEVDVFFFVPRNMGGTSDTFPRDRFFANLTHYLRVHAPQHTVASLSAASTWSLPSADRYLAEHLMTLTRQRLSRLVVQDVRLFGCFIYTHYKSLHVRLGHVLERKDDSVHLRVERLVTELTCLEDIVRAFRQRYVHRVRYEPLLIDEEVKRAFLLVDEYVSYRRESALIRIHRRLQRMDGFNAFGRRVADALQDENDYRGQHLSIPQSTSYDREEDRLAAERETHYYRLGLLKKYVSGVLFLIGTPIRKDKVYKNAVGAVGAALAATWATLAQVQTAQIMIDGNGARMRLVLVLILGVIAYVFKDRIKELSKEYFNERMKHRIPDVETAMTYPFIDDKGRERSEDIGMSSEFLRYLGRSSVPADIAYVRDIGHRAELEPERQENIIHYSKRITLESEAFRAQLHEVRRVHDVVRFDISEFLNKLSDPHKVHSYYDPQQGVQSQEAPKVYHLNIVFRYTSMTTRKNTLVERSVDVERIRLILNKKGILRIEHVLPRGEMGYSEGHHANDNH